MSSVSIRWERRAVKELAKLTRDDQKRIVLAVESLPASPLRGEPLSAEWKGLRRLRVGTYRIIYAFDGRTLLISVVAVSLKKKVYRR